MFLDPNFFGRYLALVMILLTAVLLYDRRARVQLASVGTLAILWGCLVFTLSRSSLVALGLGMGVLAALRWRTRPVLYLAAVVVVAGGDRYRRPARQLRPQQGKRRCQRPYSGRGDLITNGIKLFGDRPVYGFGSGSFSPEYTSHFPKAAESVADSHNIPVTVASEQGIIGELAYLALVITASSRCSAALAATRSGSGSPPPFWHCCCTRCSTQPSSRTRSHGRCSASGARWRSRRAQSHGLTLPRARSAPSPEECGQMQRLLFVKSRTASFIELDEHILAERFDVHELHQPGRFSDPRRVVKEVLPPT